MMLSSNDFPGLESLIAESLNLRIANRETATR